MTKKPFWCLTDKEVAYWDSEGLFSGRSESEIAVDELKRAFYKSVEPLFTAILDFLNNVIVKLTNLIKKG